MNNLNTSFDSFVNEEINIIPKGVKKWASKTFKPGELGDIAKGIYDDIKYNFNPDGLKVKTESGGGTFHKVYIYTNKLGDVIQSREYSLHINDEPLSMENAVNDYIIKDVYELLRKKYFEPGKAKSEAERRERVNTMRTKYGSRYTGMYEEGE